MFKTVCSKGCNVEVAEVKNLCSVEGCQGVVLIVSKKVDIS